MKCSIFNSVIILSDETTLVYSSMENNFLFLDNCYVHVLQQNKFSTLPEALYNELVEKKFVVLDELDEVGLLTSKKDELYEDKSLYHLIINPTLNCNLNCWYCYETKFKSKVSSELLEGIKNHISNVCSEEKPKRLNVSFFGGEPLIYFRSVALPLMEVTKKCCELKDISFVFDYTTNASLLDEKIIKEMDLYRPIFFQITIDGCKEDHDKTRFLKSGKGTYDKIIRNVKLLIQNNFHVTLRVNYTKANLNHLPSVIDDLHGINTTPAGKLSIAFERVWQDHKTGNVSEKLNAVKKMF